MAAVRVERTDLPLPLRPAPERAGHCPRCEVPLVAPRLRVTGWRMFADGRCKECGHRYLQDLPSGHGLVYPASLDVDTGETFQVGDAPWFADPLRELFERPDGDPVRLEVRGEASGSAVLLNCLDPVYGHAVLKLLDAQPLLSEDRDLIVLAPESLEALLPAGAAAAWIVREPTRRFSRWLLELEERVDHALAEVEDCVLSATAPHPEPSTYDLPTLLGAVEPTRVGDPSVVLSLRADRLWGRDASRSARPRRSAVVGDHRPVP